MENQISISIMAHVHYDNQITINKMKDGSFGIVFGHTCNDVCIFLTPEMMKVLSKRIKGAMAGIKKGGKSNV